MARQRSFPGRTSGRETGQKRRAAPPRGDDRQGAARVPGRGAGEQRFACGHCGRPVPPLPSGGHHRNHCPFCLWSRHVDDERSGDRASACGGLMEPCGAFQRPNGEHCVVHRCVRCGFERFNRIAADDAFDLVLALPEVPPRAALRPGQRAPGDPPE